MAFYKKFKKTTGKASTAVKKRYGIGKGRGGFKISQVAKDVEMIKSRLNVEKKFIDQDLVNDATVGQSNDESYGYYIADVTPEMSQGVGENNRIGNSIKLTGMVIRANFRQQSSSGKRIAKVCLIRSKTQDAGNDVVNDLFDNNPLTGFVDFHSPMNYAGMRGRASSHQIVATRYVKIESSNDEDAVATLKMPVKLNDLLRFSSNSDTSPEDCRYKLVIFLDYGNRNILSSTSNLGCVIPGVATGAILNHQVRAWYVDN